MYARLNVLLKFYKTKFNVYLCSCGSGNIFGSRWTRFAMVVGSSTELSGKPVTKFFLFCYDIRHIVTIYWSTLCVRHDCHHHTPLLQQEQTQGEPYRPLFTHSLVYLVAGSKSMTIIHVYNTATSQ